MPINCTQRYTEYALLGILGLAPIFALTVRGWTTLTLVLAAVLSIALLIIGRKSNNKLNQNLKEPIIKSNANFWVWLMIITLASPVLAILISQSLRHDWVWKAYDAPMRFLVAIPLFLCIYKRNIPVMKVWQWSFPLAGMITLVLLPHLASGGWSGDITRVTTSFVDPLTFGHITLTFGLLCLFIYNNKETKSWVWKTFKLFGLAAGIYLSIKSGSRTGWVALPILLLLLCLTNTNIKRPLVAALLGITLGIGISLLAYKTSNIVHGRVNFAFKEIVTYNWNKENSSTSSVGARLSFARMGLYYFMLKPWSGWGENGFKEHINDPFISRFTDQATRICPLDAGFHNEFTTNIVNYGVWGLFSTTLLFFVPLSLFIWAYLKRSHNKAALIGSAYIICELSSSMSTEVWNLKFTAALSALMIASICGVMLGGEPLQQSRILGED